MAKFTGFSTFISTKQDETVRPNAGTELAKLEKELHEWMPFNCKDDTDKPLANAYLHLAFQSKYEEWKIKGTRKDKLAITPLAPTKMGHDVSSIWSSGSKNVGLVYKAKFTEPQQQAQVVYVVVRHRAQADKWPG